MKTHPRRNVFRRLFRFACGVAALAFAQAAGAADASVLAALRAADDARVAATTAADRARLEAIYSDDLHYGHSNGKADTKSSQIEALVQGGTAYEIFDYKERTFVPVAPDVALMKGRVLIHLRRKSGDKDLLDLSYLAVWRQERGQWRFLAWQSCRNPPPVAQK